MQKSYLTWNVVGQNFIILRRIQPTGGTYKDKEEVDCLEGWPVAYLGGFDKMAVFVLVQQVKVFLLAQQVKEFFKLSVLYFYQHNR